MAYATDGQLPKDIYGSPAEGVYVANTGTVAQQGGVITSDGPGAPSAPAVIALSPTVSIPTPADSTAFAGTMPAVRMEQTGTGVASPVRIAGIFKTFAAQAITAGTGVVIWTPASGKKFRVLAYSLSLSVAGYLIFRDGGAAGTVVLNSAAVTAGTGTSATGMGNGLLSAAANNTLAIDASASGTVSGWVAGIEE